MACAGARLLVSQWMPDVKVLVYEEASFFSYLTDILRNVLE